ncbi:2Fe-2S iron-sulfur cluster-binding protein, partial [Chloroflexota bacterium]
MSEYRIAEHPILPVESWIRLSFQWQGQKLIAKQGETIASALFASGIRIFGNHAKDGAPQG